jgi:hypothetical protein
MRSRSIDVLLAAFARPHPFGPSFRFLFGDQFRGEEIRPARLFTGLVLVGPICTDYFSRALLDRRFYRECAKREIAVSEEVGTIGRSRDNVAIIMWKPSDVVR